MAARPATESARRVSGCVTELLRTQPFFGSLALRLPIRPDPSRKTLASDGQEIRYSPQWIAQTEAHRVETAIARVVLALCPEASHPSPGPGSRALAGRFATGHPRPAARSRIHPAG